jgi:hypothetical protein
MGMIERILEIALGVRLAKAFATPDQEIQDREDARTQAICAAIEHQQKRQELREDFSRMIKTTTAELDKAKTALMQVMQGATSPADAKTLRERLPGLLVEIKNTIGKLDGLKTVMQDIAAPSDLSALDKLAAELDEINRIAHARKQL